jgi:transposase
MGRFVKGEDRYQQTMLPACLEDYIVEDNAVRVADAFIEELDLSGLGFERVQPAATGRPAYHPATLLKIYLYGYLNRIQSSRRLEREAGRNVELMWLTGRLAPDFKTIADFRRANGSAIRAVCARFIVICGQLGLFSHAVAAIDGAKFKGVNSRDRNFTRGKLKRRVEQVEASIERYLQSLDAADLQEGEIAEAKTSRLRDKIAAMKAKLAELRQLETAVLEAPDQQISLTDPHPMTQGKIERWHLSLKSRILLENYYLPGDLERAVAAFVDNYNHRRYHESLDNLTPADVYFGRGPRILKRREDIKRRTIKQRRRQHFNAAA